MLDRLFGAEGDREGDLRVGPLRAKVAGASEVPDLSLRHHVSLERATRQAAPGRLFQNRVTASGYDLHFEGEMTVSRELTPEEGGLLESARRITDQIGGGRGRGLGLVALEIERGDETDFEKMPAAVDALTSEISTVMLVLRATEPLQLGIVKDLTNVEPSKDHLDGSAVRGAVAATLTKMGHDDRLEPLLGGDRPALFGSGYPGHVTSVPAPLTLREPKVGGRPIDSSAHLCAYVVADRPLSHGRSTTAAKGSFALGCAGWSKFRVRRRMITRTARNLVDGRAADGRLFSLEVVEATLEASSVSDDRRLLFYVPVTGDAKQIRWIAEAAKAGLVVGGARTRGFGTLVLEDVLTEPPFPGVGERHSRWVDCLRKLEVSRIDAESTGAVLALGPLAVDQRRLVRTLRSYELELIHGVSRRQIHGGWNTQVNLPRTVSSHFVPGSVFIVRRSDGGSALGSLTQLEARGIGPGRPDGWGNVVACHPIHVDCFKEDRE